MPRKVGQNGKRRRKEKKGVNLGKREGEEERNTATKRGIKEEKIIQLEEQRKTGKFLKTLRRKVR